MLLSTEGIEPNRAMENGETPLYIACQKGHLDVVRMLLSVDGIDPNRANANKQTPVNIASYKWAPRDRPPPADAPGTGHHHEGHSWGDAPETNAREQGHTAIASLLREHAAPPRPAE